jgi:hypothetical protein
MSMVAYRVLVLPRKQAHMCTTNVSKDAINPRVSREGKMTAVMHASRGPPPVAEGQEKHGEELTTQETT